MAPYFGATAFSNRPHQKPHRVFRLKSHTDPLSSQPPVNVWSSFRVKITGEGWVHVDLNGERTSGTMRRLVYFPSSIFRHLHPCDGPILVTLRLGKHAKPREATRRFELRPAWADGHGEAEEWPNVGGHLSCLFQ